MLVAAVRAKEDLELAGNRGFGDVPLSHFVDGDGNYSADVLSVALRRFGMQFTHTAKCVTHLQAKATLMPSRTDAQLESLSKLKTTTAYV